MVVVHLMHRVLLVFRKGKYYWKDRNNCRAFFDDWAREKGFDPLDIENWYAVKLPRNSYLRKTFSGCRKALQFAYPELEFTRWNNPNKKPRRLRRVQRMKRLLMATISNPTTIETGTPTTNLSHTTS